MTERHGQATARAQIAAAALLFSTGGAAIKATALGAWQVAGIRSAIAFVFLVAVLPAARRGWTWATLLVGMAYGGTMVLFVTANKLTTAASSIFLQSAAPLYLLPLSPWLLREPIRRRDFAFLAALAGGMAMFFLGTEAPRQSAPNPLLGNWVAVASGATWALTIAGMRWMAKHGASGGGAASALAAGNLIAASVCLPMALPIGRFTAADAATLGYLGVVQIGLAYLFFSNGLKRLPALEVSLLVLLEPVLNPVWAWIFQGERPSAWAIGGGLTILTATAVRTLLHEDAAADPERPEPAI
ncbi:MAG: DMT family transporter [Holophagales bacterium]|nr:MAG: DMT family transporter [Holophagales bacterium]